MPRTRVREKKRGINQAPALPNPESLLPNPEGATPPHTLLNTNVPLVPPKPNPLDIATSICFSRATFGT